MAIVPVFTLGVFGYAKISNIQVLLTSGNVVRDIGVTYTTPLYLPAINGIAGGNSVSKVAYSEGTIAVTGNIGFDVNEKAMKLFDVSKLFKRGYQFPLKIYDSERGYEISNCFITNLSVTGSSGGLVTASMSFIGGPRSGIKEIVDFRQIAVADGSWSRDDSPVGYWASGNEDVRDWTLTYTQVAEPVYLNGINDTDDRYCRYIKVGGLTYTLDVTTFNQIYEYDNIVISTKNFTVVGNTKSEGYTFGGATEIGTFSHNFESAVPYSSVSGSSGAVLIQE